MSLALVYRFASESLSAESSRRVFLFLRPIKLEINPRFGLFATRTSPRVYIYTVLGYKRFESGVNAVAEESVRIRFDKRGSPRHGRGTRFTSCSCGGVYFDESRTSAMFRIYSDEETLFDQKTF